MLSGPPVATTAEQLLNRFVTAGGRQRRSLLSQLQVRVAELLPLIPHQLSQLDRHGDDWAAGTLIQLLQAHAESHVWQQWQAEYPDGWLLTTSGADLSYEPLQSALVKQDYERADRLTSELLRQLAGDGAIKRGYVYYSEVPPIPVSDLQAIDRLWLCYSQARFGFTVQARLLRSCNQRWEQLWPRIGWKQAGIWTRYPGSFTWSLEAPEGHMPLINQLRGVRLMDAVLRHPAIEQRLT